MSKKIYFQTTHIKKIDAENGEILGVSVISTPEAKGHNLKIDGKSIESFFNACDGKQIKAFMTHQGNESPADVIGIWENFRIEEDGEFTKLLADFSALDSWKRNNPKEYESLFELAEVAPETFGISAEFVGYGIQYDEDGNEIEFDGESEGDVFARCAEDGTSGFSVVLQPASNPTGLFSEKDHPIPNESHFLEFASDEIENKQDEILILQKENQTLLEQIKTLEELSELLNEERKIQEEEIQNLTSDLQEKIDETKIWKTKFSNINNTGANPIEDLHLEHEELNLIEKIHLTSSWKEKQKLFTENISELSKNWKTLNQ